MNTAALLFLAAAAGGLSAPRADNDPARSVVLVQVYRVHYDWTMPWRQEPVESVSGSGFLIEGGRIVTNAHVVADAREVLVRRSDQADPFVATVEAEGDDCDLAVLRITDPTFARGLRALPLGEVPRTGSRVVTYGFPLGGQDVSSTAGIVSRVESRGYAHSGADEHLVVQTDAAINPGNSGGPVVQEGHVVGVAFQGYPGFENMGFFIPVPVVRHFLDDLTDGRHDGFPDSGLETMPLLSPAYRRERGLPEGRTGVVLERVRPGGSFDGRLLPGDVILAVEGQPVANDGSIALGDARVTFEHRLDMKQVGEMGHLTIWRDGREMEVDAPARRIDRADRMRNRYGVAPRYVVYAGLLFLPLDVELLKTFGRNWPVSADRNLVWHQLYREAEQPETADREVVVLARVLRHPVNSQMSVSGPAVVARINGRTLRGLADVPAALAAAEGPYDVFEFEGFAGIEVLDRAQADAAHAEVLRQYAIPKDSNL